MGPGEQADVGTRNWFSGAGSENSSSGKGRYEGSAGRCKPSFQGVCPDACSTLNDVTMHYRPGDDRAKVDCEQIR